MPARLACSTVILVGCVSAGGVVSTTLTVKLVELTLPDASRAVHVTVVAYDDYRVGATWEVASCNPGTSAPEECERALCEIVGRLRQHFDIEPT